MVVSAGFAVKLFFDVNKLHLIGNIHCFLLFFEFLLGKGTIFYLYFTSFEEYLLPACEENEFSQQLHYN